MTGRPSIYTEELAKKICVKLAEGESLRSICQADDMPHRSTVYDWLFSMPIFADQYTRAREEQAETMADEIVDIADETVNDWVMTERGSEVVNTEAIARSKLRVEARKWVAAKLKPKKYGEKQSLEVTGKGGGALQTVTTIRIVAGNGSDSPAAA